MCQQTMDFYHYASPLRIPKGKLPCNIFVNAWNQGHRGPSKVRNRYITKLCLVNGLCTLQLSRFAACDLHSLERPS